MTRFEFSSEFPDVPEPVQPSQPAEYAYDGSAIEQPSIQRPWVPVPVLPAEHALPGQRIYRRTQEHIETAGVTPELFDVHLEKGRQEMAPAQGWERAGTKITDTVQQLAAEHAPYIEAQTIAVMPDGTLTRRRALHLEHVNPDQSVTTLSIASKNMVVTISAPPIVETIDTEQIVLPSTGQLRTYEYRVDTSAVTCRNIDMDDRPIAVGGDHAAVLEALASAMHPRAVTFEDIVRATSHAHEAVSASADTPAASQRQVTDALDAGKLLGDTVHSLMRNSKDVSQMYQRDGTTIQTALEANGEQAASVATVEMRATRPARAHEIALVADKLPIAEAALQRTLHIEVSTQYTDVLPSEPHHAVPPGRCSLSEGMLISTDEGQQYVSVYSDTFALDLPLARAVRNFLVQHK